MADEYTPIQTKADRRAERVEAVKDAAIGFGKGLIKAIGEATDRLVVQGRDEAANALFAGDAYWPGQQPPSIDPKKPEEQQEGHGIHGDTAMPTQEHSASVDAYGAGSYQQPKPDHNSQYLSHLNDAAKRSGNDNERGMSR
jgi:hypothetical protein